MADEWAAWRTVLGCPNCQGTLSIVDGDELTCDRCGVIFAVQDDVPVFLDEDEYAAFDDFARVYRADRLREGWSPMSSAAMLSLPFSSPAGYPPLYWQVRRQTFHSIARLLEKEGPTPEAGPVADLGAGIGWLGYRLAELGYRVLAVDVSLDDDFGLGAAAPYVEAAAGRLRLARGDLCKPPLQKDCWSLVIFNASLHYARDLVSTLRRAARALMPDGRLLMLDTPVSRQPVPGTGRGDRHLGWQELSAAFEQAGLQSRAIRVWRGPRWWIYGLRCRIRGTPVLAFPILVARRNRD